jgi:hypothetical protein
MSSSPPPPVLFGRVMDVTVQQDTPCRKCGYNLRMLSASGRCPECGTAVGYSLQGDLLRFMDPNWVETLSRGVSLVIYGILAIIAGIIGVVVLAIATRSTAATLAIGGLVALVGSVMILAGWWFFTQPDPSGLGEDQYGTPRKVIRVTLAIGVVQQVLSLIGVLAPLRTAAESALAMFATLLGLAAVVGLFAQLSYLEKITLRIPDHALSDRARFLKPTLGSTYCLALFLQLIQAASGGSNARAAGSQAAGCGQAIVGLAMLIFGIMYLLLLDKVRKQLGQQAFLARSTWAAQAHGPTAP